MSSHETETGQPEAKSSIEITLTAKGTRQWKVKVYASDASERAIDWAYDKAVELETKLVAKYGLPA